MELTNKIKEWFESDERDFDEGAMLLLRVSKNRVMNQYLSRKRDTEKLEYELKKILQLRNVHIEPEPLKETEPTEKNDLSPERTKGKREDHDKLPEEVQICYDRAMLLYPQLRALHEKVKLAETTEKRKPLNDELKKMEDALASSWEVYDSYDINNQPASEKIVIDAKRIASNRKYISDNRKAGWKNLEKKRPEIQKRISEVYEVGENFSDETVKELTDLGFKCTK